MLKNQRRWTTAIEFLLKPVEHRRSVPMVRASNRHIQADNPEPVTHQTDTVERPRAAPAHLLTKRLIKRMMIINIARHHEIGGPGRS